MWWGPERQHRHCAGPHKRVQRQQQTQAISCSVALLQQAFLVIKCCPASWLLQPLMARAAEPAMSTLQLAESWAICYAGRAGLPGS